MSAPKQLIDAYIDGTLDDAGFDELCGWLREDASNRRAFTRALSLHSGIADWVQDKSGGLLMPELSSNDSSADGIDWFEAVAALSDDHDVVEPVDFTDELAQRERQAKEKSRRARRRAQKQHALAEQHQPFVISKLAVVLAAAAMLGLIAWLGWPGTQPVDSSDRTSQQGAGESRAVAPATNVAMIRSTLDARWVGMAYDSERRLAEGKTVTLRAGLAEVVFADGAVVVVQGPVTFEPTGPNGMRLESGRIVATVPPAAIGFTVDTPTARIVDYGTEFGVHADGDHPTQVQVFQGEIRSAVRVEGVVVGEPVRLIQQQAAVIDAGGASIARVAFDPDAFERRIVKRLDLMDIVAGGDGTGHQRDIGIDATSGQHLAGLADSLDAYLRRGDGQFRPAHGSPFVAGVFIPGETPAAVSLPGGVTLPALPPTEGTAYGLIWCGGLIPTDSSSPLSKITTVIGGTDYAAAGHQLISLHANAGLVIDLDAIRTAYPGYEVARVTGVIDNTMPDAMFTTASTPVRAAFRAFLDSDLALNQTIEVAFNRRTSPIQLDLEPGDARYLTLVATDGGDTNGGDWIVVGDPVIELRPTQ